jgi:hypothetical protein
VSFPRVTSRPRPVLIFLLVFTIARVQTRIQICIMAERAERSPPEAAARFCAREAKGLSANIISLDTHAAVGITCKPQRKTPAHNMQL